MKRWETASVWPGKWGLRKRAWEYWSRDEIFNKDPRFLHPVKTSKFYAFRIRVGCHGTIGGIKINERAEVLNKKDEVIPGLYSAGYDACCIYGHPTDYNWFVPGGTFSFALNSGRIAEESALNYLHNDPG